MALKMAEKVKPACRFSIFIVTVPGKIIDLSQAAADRLNLTNSTKVRVDFINVAQDGTLSGPGTIGTTVAKQSYALPSRPSLGASNMGTPTLASPGRRGVAAEAPGKESVAPCGACAPP